VKSAIIKETSCPTLTSTAIPAPTAIPTTAPNARSEKKPAIGKQAATKNPSSVDIEIKVRKVG
jgi:hypothetical protein